VHVDLISETLVTLCIVFDGEEADLDDLEAALQEEVDSGGLDPDFALFRFRLAEIYNESSVHRSQCST
jgi:hypothetical protein